MRTLQSLAAYLIIFLILAVASDFLGIIEFESIELISYSFIFAGIGLSYWSLGSSKSIPLFFGTAAFLIGILIFITFKYDFKDASMLTLPSILLITGVSLLMSTYISGVKAVAILGVIFVTAGIIFTILLGNINFETLINAAASIIKNYWLILLIVIGIILILTIDEKRR